MMISNLLSVVLRLLRHSFQLNFSSRIFLSTDERKLILFDIRKIETLDGRYSSCFWFMFHYSKIWSPKECPVMNDVCPAYILLKNVIASIFPFRPCIFVYGVGEYSNFILAFIVQGTRALLLRGPSAASIPSSRGGGLPVPHSVYSAWCL